MTEASIFPVVLGVFAYALMNSGMSTQKLAVEVWLTGKQMLRSRANRRKLAVWFLGLFQVGLASALLPVAVAYSNISTISPLSGSGFVVVALFSRYVLGEQLTRKHLAAIGIIVGGTVWLGLHLRDPGQTLSDEWLLWSVVGAGLLLIVLSCGLSARNQYRWAGPIFAASAALIASCALFFPGFFADAIKTLETDRTAGAMALAHNAYAYLYVLFNVLALVPAQVAYTHGRAIVVIPIYSSLYMVLPVLGGLVLFDERLAAAQWLGVLVTLCGVLTMTLVPDASLEARAVAASPIEE